MFRRRVGGTAGSPAVGPLVVAGWVVVLVLGATVIAHGVWGERWVPLIAVGAVGPLLLLPVWPVFIGGVLARRIPLVVAAFALIGFQVLWASHPPGSPTSVSASPSHLVLRSADDDHGTAAGTAVPGRLRVLSANLKYDNGNTAALAGQIRRSDPDVVVLIEYSPLSRRQVDASGVLGRYPYRLLAPEGGSVGLAMFSRLPLVDAEVRTLVEPYRPLLEAKIIFEGIPVRVFAAHTVAPRDPADAVAWHAEIARLTSLVASVHGPVLLAADLNATGTNDAFIRLCSATGLTETGPDVHLGATWPVHAWVPPFLRPDHVLVSAPLQPVAASTGAESGSDHLPVIVDVAAR